MRQITVESWCYSEGFSLTYLSLQMRVPSRNEPFTWGYLSSIPSYIFASGVFATASSPEVCTGPLFSPFLSKPFTSPLEFSADPAEVHEVRTRFFFPLFPPHDSSFRWKAFSGEDLPVTLPIGQKKASPHSLPISNFISSLPGVPASLSAAKLTPSPRRYASPHYRPSAFFVSFSYK